MNEQPIYQDLSRFQLPQGFRGASAIKVQLWWLVQSSFFGASPQFMYGWRRFLLRLFGAKIGKFVLIRPTARVTYPWKLKIGDYSQIGDRVQIYNLGDVEIGRNVVISQDSYLCGGGHRHDLITFDIYSRDIRIDDEAWLAAQCFVMPGITIGRGAFAKVRSLIVKNVDQSWIVAGAPARKVGDRLPIVETS